MKKLLLSTLMAVSCVAIANNALAEKNMGGGFAGPEAKNSYVTAEQAKNMSDDTYVTLRGNIKESLGNEKYTFADTSGTIVVEIDNDDWNGLSVKPEDLVEIKGEVDTHWNKPSDIDVDTISLVSKQKLKIEQKSHL